MEPLAAHSPQIKSWKRDTGAQLLETAEEHFDGRGHGCKANEADSKPQDPITLSTSQNNTEFIVENSSNLWKDGRIARVPESSEVCGSCRHRCGQDFEGYIA